MSRKQLTYRLTEEREKYLKKLKRRLEKVAGRSVSYQEILDHLVDLLMASTPNEDV